MLVNVLLFFGFAIFLMYVAKQLFVEQGERLFEPRESFGIEACQAWAGEVRSFNLAHGEEATRVSVLSYAKIVKTGAKDVEDVSLAAFKEQMAFLESEGFTVLTSSELAQFLAGELDVPAKSVVLTFDDAQPIFFKEVAELLRKHHFSGIMFVDTGHASVAELKDGCDHFDYQSHSFNMHREKDGKSLLLVEDEQQIKEDLAASIVNLGKKQPLFAYPYGQYDEEIMRTVRELSFQMAFTIDEGEVRPGMNAYKLPRKLILNRDDLQTFQKKLYGW